MARSLWGLAAIWMVFAPVTLCPEARPLNNEDILRMVQAGFDEPTILKAIETSGTSVDTSPESLIRFKEAGLSQEFVRTVVALPKVSPSVTQPSTASQAGPPSGSLPDTPPPEAGIYIQRQGRWVVVEPEVVNSSWGAGRVRGVLPGMYTPFQVHAPLEFWVVCPEGITAAEYQLVRVHKTRDRRQFQIAFSVQPRESVGPGPDSIDFQADEVTPRAYHIRLQGLPYGEYGFLAPMASFERTVATQGKIHSFHYAPPVGVPPTAPGSAEKPLVYFFFYDENLGDVMPGVFGIGRLPAVKVFADDRLLASLARGSFFAAQLDPGSHKLRTKDGQSLLEIDLAPGQQYYFQVSWRHRGFRMRAYLTPSTPDQARSSIRRLTPLEKKHIEDASMVTVAYPAETDAPQPADQAASVSLAAAPDSEQVEAKPLTNDDIVSLLAQGRTENAIIETIAGSETSFDTSADALAAPKTAGLSEAVIRAMQEKSELDGFGTSSREYAALPERPGVFVRTLHSGGPESFSELQAELISSHASSDFWAYLGKVDLNGAVRHPQSMLRLKPPAEIVIRTPEGVAVQEFQFLKLWERSNRRECRIVKTGVFHSESGAQSNAVPFEAEAIGNRVYRVRLPALAKGEYGFLPPGAYFRATAASLGTMYTFGVD